MSKRTSIMVAVKWLEELASDREALGSIAAPSKLFHETLLFLHLLVVSPFKQRMKNIILYLVYAEFIQRLN